MRTHVGVSLEALAVVAALSMSTPLSGQPPVRTAPVTSAAPGASSATAGDLDRLRPGDVVRLRIWREPDLSGDFPVNETGMVVLPRLGPLSVVAESSGSLRARLVDAYAEFLNHRSIDVTLLRRIQVLGAVRQPGVYPVDPTMTISDVLAVAGGATTDGDPNKLELIRDGQQIPGRISRQSLISESHVRSGDQIFVPERGWVRRNSGFLAAAIITASMGVAATIITR
jgi:protein involved in polysaccharide export with SLBB domain